MDISRIRNFSIIAHIDHGKSTLADRLLEATNTISQREMRAQILDDMDLERERGITIKSHAIRMDYKYSDGETYILNLIDTPGHVDFSYEVSRSLAACEGALLVVDATQGVEAQTLSTLYQALDNDLHIIPVINKIDLPNAQIEMVTDQITELIGCNKSEIVSVSAKTGYGIKELLEEIVIQIPPPKGDPDEPLQMLIFDSIFDNYRGAIPYVRVVNGRIKAKTKIFMFSNEKTFEVDEVGYLKLKKEPREELIAGDVGYLVANIRNVSDTRVGDTITDALDKTAAPLPGYRPAKPMVFAGLYPVNSDEYNLLKDALDKLKLNDSSLIYEPETSKALGFGFRCGFLGLLHMEIVQERLYREYNMEIITTVPNVEYIVYKIDGEVMTIDNPSNLPEPNFIEKLEEPIITSQIITPSEFIGNVMKLASERRGIHKQMEYVDKSRVNLNFEFPLVEIVFDFYDKLKTISKGYASLDYEFLEYRESDLEKLDILLNGEPIDALSMVVHREKAYFWGKKLVQKLRKLIPRQLYEVVIQAAIGSRVIARESIKALRKNVIAKCYGGDISRKRKLLDKQKEGKKRMKRVGKVEIPQEAFLAILTIEDED
jgi:GTP-binding protein LepA